MAKFVRNIFYHAQRCVICFTALSLVWISDACCAANCKGKNTSYNASDVFAPNHEFGRGRASDRDKLYFKSPNGVKLYTCNNFNDDDTCPPDTYVAMYDTTHKIGNEKINNNGVGGWTNPDFYKCVKGTPDHWERQHVNFNGNMDECTQAQKYDELWVRIYGYKNSSGAVIYYHNQNLNNGIKLCKATGCNGVVDGNYYDKLPAGVPTPTEYVGDIDLVAMFRCFCSEGSLKVYCVISSCVTGYRLQYKGETGYNDCVPDEESEETQPATETPSSPAPATPSTGAGTSVSTASKTVKERCKEYNNNVDCTPERLECYKKGSATTWEDGKCKCTSANKEWDFKNNAGRCVEKQVSVKDISADTYCEQNNVSKNAGADKTSASGTNWSVVFDYDTMTGKSLCHTSGSGKIAKGTTSSNGNYCWCALQDEADWVFLEQISNNCSGTCAKKCADKVASDKGFRKSVFYCPEEKKEDKPAEQKPVAPEKKDPQVENAKQVLAGFFNSAYSTANVWKNEEGKFNTARLASDLGAAVVLGTVGGVVSGTVIKKKQIKKGFESLQCYIGGRAMAGWGDTFNVDLAR